ncbi:hypothetical protein FJZ18_00385 [Candidatus Pacearchaeota archaeon]|nr:hypothetical protein [Candidatus Pacearchaeota archaeon]
MITGQYESPARIDQKTASIDINYLCSSGGNVLDAFLIYIQNLDTNLFTPLLTRIEVEPNAFSPLVDSKRTAAFRHDNRGLVYIAVPINGPHVIAIQGSTVDRACATPEVRTLGNILKVPVNDLSSSEGEKYFLLKKSLKTLTEL